jgi:hypothetical protein
MEYENTQRSFVQETRRREIKTTGEKKVMCGIILK